MTWATTTVAVCLLDSTIKKALIFLILHLLELLKEVVQMIIQEVASLLARACDFAVLHTGSTKTIVFVVNPQGFSKF